MTDRLRAAAQAALEALVNDCDWRVRSDAANGLRAALVEAPSDSSSRVGSEEPYIWYADDTGDTWTPEAVAGGYAPSDLRPLYTAPPRREWVTLTEEEIEAAIRPLCGENESVLRQLIDFSIDEYRAIEAALKERNA